MGDETIGADSTGQVTDQSTSQPSQTVSNQPAEPTVYQVKDDSLIQPEGFSKPVKYGEHVRGLQSEFTKARQQAAQLQRDLETERQRRAQYEAYYRHQSQGQQPDVYAQLRELPYLSGEDAAGVVQSIAQQFQQRDAILITALRELKAMKETLGGLYSNHSNSVFESKIAKFTSDAGLPDDAREFVADLYSAYEGDDLDLEFPRILRERLEQINKVIEAQRSEKVRQARRNPFVPGRGGDGRPSQPLQLKGNEDPRQVADLLWEQMRSSGT